MIFKKTNSKTHSIKAKIKVDFQEIRIFIINLNNRHNKNFKILISNRIIQVSGIIIKKNLNKIISRTKDLSKEISFKTNLETRIKVNKTNSKDLISHKTINKIKCFKKMKIKQFNHKPNNFKTIKTNNKSTKCLMLYAIKACKTCRIKPRMTNAN